MATIDFNHWKGMEIGCEVIANLQQQAELQIISALQPKFSKDGNMFCYLYGELPNDCVIGFGTTASEAMRDFCKNFHTAKP